MSTGGHAFAYLVLYIKQIKLDGFRCYDAVQLIFSERINLFYGDNGAGKTSVLEAIYWLSTGKSFRSKKNKVLINQHKSELVLFAELSDHQSPIKHSLGISFNKSNKKQIRLDKQSINNQSQVAHLLPVVSIDPDSYLFIDKTPQFRRSFLDWLVFHVKPEYLSIWSNTTRCQKQLNVLYKSKQQDLLPQWEQQYIQFATQLNELRQHVFNDLTQSVSNKVKSFIPEITGFNLSFKQGWSEGLTLGELLEKERPKNLLYGSLFSGVHKMDIKCQVKQQPAQDLLSRGQKKLISIIFYFSFIELLAEKTGNDPLIVIDDMDAELDISKTKLLCDFIMQASNQVFISSVDPKKVTDILDDVGVFHVKPNREIVPADRK